MSRVWRKVKADWDAWNSRSLAEEPERGPDVPILANAPGDMSLLKPGAAVFVIALKKPDGTVTAARLYAEKDGIKPPM